MDYIGIILPFVITLIVLGIKLYKARSVAEMLDIIQQDSPEIVDKARVVMLRNKGKDDKQL